VLLATLLACQTANAPIKVVKEVDLDRYVGRWCTIGGTRGLLKSDNPQSHNSPGDIGLDGP
jgi:lipocalin